MSEGLNMVTLFGNLGADPELRQTQGGPVLKMRLATTEVYFDKEKQRKERTEWHDVAVFGRRAEGLSTFLTKGARIFIKGRLRTSSYEKEGQKHYRTEVVADEVLLGGGGAARQNGGYVRPPAPEAVVTSADLPF